MILIQVASLERQELSISAHLWGPDVDILNGGRVEAGGARMQRAVLVELWFRTSVLVLKDSRG